MNVSVKDLLDAGVHFGHQVRRWNPKSKPFVYDNRHGISIIDLEKTYDLLEKAAQAVEEVVGSGKQVLICLLYTSPSPRDQRGSRMPSSA